MYNFNGKYCCHTVQYSIQFNIGIETSPLSIALLPIATVSSIVVSISAEVPYPADCEACVLAVLAASTVVLTFADVGW